MLRIGDVAPDFELKLHTGVRFRLSDQQGERNIVLYFYPKDFAWNLSKNGLFSKNIAEIHSLDAAIIGISGESFEEHKKFARQYDLPFPLASDPNLEVCRNYRALWLRGVAVRRITYIIDKRQRIRGIARHELFIDRHWKHVIRVLRELKEHESIKAYNRQAWEL